MDGIFMLAETLKKLAPNLAPQIIPAASVASSGDPHTALAKCFTTQEQKTELLDALSEQQQRAEKAAGGKVFLALMVELNISRRLVTIERIRFVGEVERNLLRAELFLQMQLDGSEEEVKLCSDHFVALNDRQAESLEEINVVLAQEAYSVAYALKVLLDNVPNWTTKIGTQVAPVGPDESVTSVLDVLRLTDEKRSKRRKISKGGDQKKRKKKRDSKAS